MGSTLQWPGGDEDRAYSLAVDGLGNVYVTGKSKGLNTGFDYATIKYTADGKEAWVARYNGQWNSRDEAYSLAVDGSGNVYVTGMSETQGSGYGWEDYTTIKYTAEGKEEWVAHYNGPGDYDDYAQAISVDGLGNVYITGYSKGSGTDFDYATIKYTAAGTKAWVARYNGPGNSGDEACSIAVDGSGNVYVTGRSWGSGNNYSYEYGTIKYTAAGTEAWVARYRGPMSWGYSFARSLAVDGSGNVYVTGMSDGDYATIKYTADGTKAWVARYNGPENRDDFATSLAIDGSGNVYVTGQSNDVYTTFYATIKYTAAGTKAWVVRNSEGDYALAIAVDGSGNVYVTGMSGGSNSSYYTTIKYEQVPLSVAEKNGPLPQSYVLEQNYPNPFNPETSISFQIPKSCHVIIKIYNTVGQEIRTLIDEKREAGYHQIAWDGKDNSGKQVGTGIYIYQLKAEEFVAARKMVMIQ